MNIQETSGNSHRNALNVNCSCYGSNVLIRFDTLDFIRTQFQKFEKRFRCNEHTQYDMKLPLFIIESFSRLWKLWKEIPEFHQLIDAETFYNIFTDMFSTFQTDNIPSPNTNVVESSAQLSGLNLVCNECNEPIPVLNDDITLSYDLHAQDPKHIKALEKPPNENVCHFSSNKVKPEILNAKITSEETKRSQSPPWLKKKIIKTQGLKTDNELPSTTSTSKSAVNFSQSSGLQQRNTSRTTKPHKLPTANDPYCGVCVRQVPGTKEILAEHPYKKNHVKQLELLEKCETLLKHNKPYVVLCDRSKFEFVCELCEKRQIGTNCFLQHLKSKEHIQNMNKATEGSRTHSTEEVPLATTGSVLNPNVLQFL